MKFASTRVALLLTLVVGANCHAQDCNSMGPKIGVGRTTVIAQDIATRKLLPQFFGFNLETIEFENSLWDKVEHRVAPSVVQYLRRFPGAVYRYPGGSVVNQFNWKAAIGPESARTPQKVVPWLDARIIRFGPLEYLEFVRQVGGTPWYTLNLYGSFNAPLPTEFLADSAAALARFMSDQRARGFPGIYRWELGNELDRGHIRWPASIYTTAANNVASSVRANYQGAEFVGMVQDWAHDGYSSPGINYNTAVARDLSNTTKEFAAHLYYDGAPWGLPLPRVLLQLCKNVASLKEATPDPTIWITEHARTPLGTPDDAAWRTNWPQSGSLAAAISTADMMISAARRDDVQGAFIHALHGTTGPWPMFHKRPDGSVVPSAVYWSMVALRETLLEDVLTSSINTTDIGVNGVGYDTNAVVLADPSRSRFSSWAVNRTRNTISMQFTIPRLANKRIVLAVSTIAGNLLEDGNYSESFKIFPRRQQLQVVADANGTFVFAQAPYSVNTLKIEMAPAL